MPHTPKSGTKPEHKHVADSKAQKFIDAREEWAAANRAAYLAPGYVLLVELSSKGGSTTTNYQERRVGKTWSDVVYRKEVDNRDLEQRVRDGITKIRWMVNARATQFFAGTYFTTEEAYKELVKDLEVGRQIANALNKSAAEIGSNRVTRLSAFTLKVDLEDREVSMRLAEAMYERLVSLREAYGAETKGVFQARLLACQNMDMLVGGTQHDVIREALDYTAGLTKTHLRKYRQRLKRGLTDEAEEILRDVDYRPIDAAIELFEKP